MSFSAAPIPWTHALIQDYLAGFQVGPGLRHRLSYFSEEADGLVSEPPTEDNAGPVAQTVFSFIESHTKSKVERGSELRFGLSVGHRQLRFHRPAGSSLLGLETRQSHRGASFAIRHVVDVSASTYLFSNFFVSFSDGAWALGLEDFLKVSMEEDAHQILKNVYRHIGLPDVMSTEEYWGRDRRKIATKPIPLLLGGPTVRVSFNHLSDGDEDLGLPELEFSVHGINPLRPYLPGGILELWRLAARVMAG